MWQMQDSWRQNKERLERLEGQKAEGMQIGDERLEAARRQVAFDERNATAIADAEKQKQANAAAERQKVDERRTQDGQAEQEAFRSRSRPLWDGDQASFDTAFPALWQQEQIRRTTERAAALAAPLPGIRL
jgi:hypothetical protein